MSNKLKKIERNSNELKLDFMMKNMDIQTYQNNLKTALEVQRRELAEEYNKKLSKIILDSEKKYYAAMSLTIETMGVEFLYELANQMNYWKEDDEYIKEQIKDRVQEVYENTMNSVKKYAENASAKNANKEFTKKKNLIKRNFKIIF